jgi:hypothetical protein
VDGRRLTQPVGVAVSPGGDVLFTDVGRDAVLEYTPSIPTGLKDLDEEDVGATPRP